MAPANSYPCALCGASLPDDPSFRRHLADAHGFVDPGTDQAAAPAPPPAPTPPTAPPVAPAPPVEAPFVFDWSGPATPVSSHQHAWQDPSPLGLGLSTEAALAAGLVVAFFLPWFNAPGFFSSSGLGMLSWLPSRVRGIESIVPYLAVLIPLGALAVLVQWWRDEPADTVATVTGALAPVVLAYAVLRGQGLNLVKVLNVGAYLTIVLSVALLGAARRWWKIPLPLNRGEVSRRGLESAGVALAVVVAALVVPVLAHQRTRDQVLAAFDLSHATTHVTSTASGTQLDASKKAPASSGASSNTTTPDAGTAVADTGGITQPAPANPSSPGPTTAPQRRVIGGTGSPTSSPSGNRPATTAPKPTTPTTAAPAAGGCPSSRPSAQITSFSPQQRADDSETYDVDISGTVRNPTSATIDLYGASIGYYDASGDRIDSGAVNLSGTLAPGQTRTWSLHDSVYSPDSPPHAVIGRLDYDWSDSNLSRCAT